MDRVFLVLFVQSDALRHFIIVYGRLKPIAHELALVVFAEVRYIYPHFFHNKNHLPSFRHKERLISM